MSANDLIVGLLALALVAVAWPDRAQREAFATTFGLDAYAPEEIAARVKQAFPEAEAIYETNMETLRLLGPEGWERLDVGPQP